MHQIRSNRRQKRKNVWEFEKKKKITLDAKLVRR